MNPLRIGDAIDLYLGELARRGRSPRTIDAYRQKLNALANIGAHLRTT